jgi:hypothetical protein
MVITTTATTTICLLLSHMFPSCFLSIFEVIVAVNMSTVVDCDAMHCSEDGSGISFRNVGNHLQDYMQESVALI